MLPGLGTSLSERRKILGGRSIEISTVRSALDVVDRHVLIKLLDVTKSVPGVNRPISEHDAGRVRVESAIVDVSVVNALRRLSGVDAVEVLAHAQEVVEVDLLAEGHIGSLNSLVVPVLSAGLEDPGAAGGAGVAGIGVLKVADLLGVGRVRAGGTSRVHVVVNKELVCLVGIGVSVLDEATHAVNVVKPSTRVGIARVLHNASNVVCEGLKERNLVEFGLDLGACLEVGLELSLAGLSLN